MAKWKVSQNQPLCNRDSIVAHLGQQKQPGSEAMAEYVLTSRKNGKRTIPDDDYRGFPDVSEHSAGGSFQVA
jgi:hypothetical protein